MGTKIETTHSGPRAMTALDGKLYIADWQKKAVFNLDPSSKKVSKMKQAPTVQLVAADICQGQLFVAQLNSADMALIDVKSRKYTRSAEAQLLPKAVHTANNLVFVANSIANSVSVLKPSGDRARTPIVTDNGPKALASIDQSLYVAHERGNSLYRYNTTTFIVEDSIKTGKRPVALATTGNTVIIAFAGEPTLTFYDHETKTVVHSVTLPAAAQGLTVQGNTAYVTIPSTNLVQYASGLLGNRCFIRT